MVLATMTNNSVVKTVARSSMKTRQTMAVTRSFSYGIVRTTTVKRRNVVLNNMMAHGDLTRDEYERLKKIPIKLDYSVESNYDGQAKYFREAVANHLKDWCEDNGYDLYTSGLKIYTTIDTRMQKYAEEAALKQMKQVQQNFNAHWGSQNPWQDENHHEIPNFIEGIVQKLPVYKHLLDRFPNSPDSIEYHLNLPHKVKLFDYDNGTIEQEMSTMDSIRYMVRFMHCGFVAMEPQTGHVKAWVGDVDFNSWKYDKVTDWVGIRAALDTDFGGKTGTSNNHSDAWFMCISPNLVCGAWVGGEYRCIHFRTGALGQGSRTALPICGYFLESVMSDPAFKQYHGRFAKPDDKDITDDMYECSSYYEQRHDTLVADSVDFHEDEEILFDEDGNPINSTAEPLDPNRIQVPNEDHKINTPQKTNEETVTFDDI